MINNLHRKTPIMGWASWNCFRTDITEEKLKKTDRRACEYGTCGVWI